MAKIGSPTKRPTSNGGFCGDQEAAPQLMINRERLNKSRPLAESVQVKFMELRPSMCRWPIGDPTSEEFAYCGIQTAKSRSYCAGHCRMAYKPPNSRVWDGQRYVALESMAAA